MDQPRLYVQQAENADFTTKVFPVPSQVKLAKERAHWQMTYNNITNNIRQTHSKWATSKGCFMYNVHEDRA
eukprot:scaffold192872_cov21-Tisochrysis_lutea.AAC.1